ncbi:unnamed protein product [Urochloa humidicola]
MSLVRITGIGITSIAILWMMLGSGHFQDTPRISDNLPISYCQVTGLGLCHLLGSLRCLQDVKMVHLSWVSIEGFEMALGASCGKLKKLKLLGGLRSVLSPELLQMLQACGCRLQWVDKQLVYKG